MVSTRSQSALCWLAWLCCACASKEAGGGAADQGGGGGSIAAGAGLGAGDKGGSSSSSGVPSASSAGTLTVAAGTGAGGSADAAGSGGSAGGSAAPATDFEQACLAGATDSCELCLCSKCTEQLQACAATDGCAPIAVCTRESQCRDIACYCGTFDALACANGQANGPCKSAILDAPGSHVPTLTSPSAGPASDAAVAISVCAQVGHPCAEACSSP